MAKVFQKIIIATTVCLSASYQVYADISFVKNLNGAPCLRYTYNYQDYDYLKIGNFYKKTKTDLPPYGWKAHISIDSKATNLSKRYETILEAILPILKSTQKGLGSQYGFKIATKETLSAWRTGNPEEDGKFITIYLTGSAPQEQEMTEVNQLLIKLNTELEKQKGNLFKRIEGELEIGKSGGLYIRYGLINETAQGFPVSEKEIKLERFKLLPKERKNKLIFYFEDRRTQPFPELFALPPFKERYEEELNSILSDLGYRWAHMPTMRPLLTISWRKATCLKKCLRKLQSKTLANSKNWETECAKRTTPYTSNR